ncbi:MAG: HAMP domain-containing sensor histidine kinase [Thermoleophilia bacterium]|nr:HAMP domain-containing sensor histidine kinase [Thermoleophilia bacterium]
MTEDAERLALVVHEVRSPVAALAAIRDALPGARGDRGACQRLARLALGACEAIDRLVREVAVTTVVPEAVDLSAVVEDVVGAAALASRREISASGTERPLVVQGDPVRLRQAVDNVVRNAIAVSPPGTAIAVSLRATRREAMISVTDAGPGIADSDRERIFEPGVRLDPQRPGSGLGLAVARGIAEAHGGRLTVESERGAGATFTLVVPRPPPQPETPTSSS